VILVSAGLRIFLIFANKRRDHAEGLATDPRQEVDPGKRELVAADYEDITDFNTLGFRYRM
jgi:hypothetical protein